SRDAVPASASAVLASVMDANFSSSRQSASASGLSLDSIREACGEVVQSAYCSSQMSKAYPRFSWVAVFFFFGILLIAARCFSADLLPHGFTPLPRGVHALVG